jgi:hypothetical protein
MSLLDDVDPDVVISRLAGPLSPADRDAFRCAAEDALARVPCWGPGAVYRAIARLQRNYFSPPDDRRAGWDIESELPHLRVSKLFNKPAIGVEGSGAAGRLRSMWRRR